MLHLFGWDQQKWLHQHCVCCIGGTANCWTYRCRIHLSALPSQVTELRSRRQHGCSGYEICGSFVSLTRNAMGSISFTRSFWLDILKKTKLNIIIRNFWSKIIHKCLLFVKLKGLLPSQYGASRPILRTNPIFWYSYLKRNIISALIYANDTFILLLFSKRY